MFDQKNLCVSICLPLKQSKPGIENITKGMLKALGLRAGITIKKNINKKAASCDYSKA